MVYPGIFSFLISSIILTGSRANTVLTQVALAIKLVTMLNFKKVLYGFALLMFCVTTTMANTKFTDLNKPIMVSKKDPVVTLTLQSNRTTGFKWLLTKYDSNMLKPISQKYYAPKKKLPGAGGYEVWKFKVKPLGFKVPQVIDINLLYAQPWELKAGKAVTFKLITGKS